MYEHGDPCLFQSTMVSSQTAPIDIKTDRFSLKMDFRNNYFRTLCQQFETSDKQLESVSRPRLRSFWDSFTSYCWLGFSYTSALGNKWTFCLLSMRWNYYQRMTWLWHYTAWTLCICVLYSMFFSKSYFRFTGWTCQKTKYGRKYSWWWILGITYQTFI